MGSVDFMTYAPGTEAGDAFRAAVEQAAWEHGHGGYTGTIAEKPDFVVIQSEPLPRKEAETLANTLMDDSDPRIDDKWGPAGALPVADESGAVIGWLFFGWASS